jgi:hypothetical protein
MINFVISQETDVNYMQAWRFCTVRHDLPYCFNIFSGTESKSYSGQPATAEQRRSTKFNLKTLHTVLCISITYIYYQQLLYTC